MSQHNDDSGSGCGGCRDDRKTQVHWTLLRDSGTLSFRFRLQPIVSSDRSHPFNLTPAILNRMPASRRTKSPPSLEPAPMKPRKTIPHQFVLDAMADLSPWTRSMFGCLAVYVDDKIVFILRDKSGDTADNGVWLATTEEHHESLRREFPTMRSIQVFRKKVTGWQVLPVSAPGFEEAALRACELVTAEDPRIGKVPKASRARSTVRKSR